MTNEEMLGVAEIVERATNRFNEQAARFRERSAAYDRLIAEMNADHEAKMVEHRAAFGARTEADRQIIEKLRAIVKEQSDHAKDAGTLLGWAPNESAFQAAQRVVKERDGLLAQVQDQRAEIERLGEKIDELPMQTTVMAVARREGEERAAEVLQSRVQDMREEIIRLNEAHGRTMVERDALRAEVAALQERLRASIARSDFAQMEVAALKSQTPKQHPVEVGDWVRRTKLPGDQSPIGIVKQVTAIARRRYHFADGDFWSVDNCEPCAHQHPAQDGQWVRRTVASGTEPVGTMFQVQRSRTLHEEYVTRGGRVVPWAHCEPCDPPEASHDTPAGKEAAEAVVRDSQMTDTHDCGPNCPHCSW